jgi:hypothetical protein
LSYWRNLILMKENNNDEHFPHGRVNMWVNVWQVSVYVCVCVSYWGSYWKAWRKLYFHYGFKDSVPIQNFVNITYFSKQTPVLPILFYVLIIYILLMLTDYVALSVSVFPLYAVKDLRLRSNVCILYTYHKV